MKVDGSIDKYKAKLIIKCYKQIEGLNYSDVCYLLMRINSIRMLFEITTLRNLEVPQVDVKKTFLNGELDKEIYIEQLEGFTALRQEMKVCKLVKSLYELKQASKQ